MPTEEQLVIFHCDTYPKRLSYVEFDQLSHCIIAALKRSHSFDQSDSVDTLL